MSTIAERARYQADERELLAELDVALADEVPCRQCGCSDSLACPQGCGSAQPDLCTVCARELEQLTSPLAAPVATRSAPHQQPTRPRNDRIGAASTTGSSPSTW